MFNYQKVKRLTGQIRNLERLLKEFELRDEEKRERLKIEEIVLDLRARKWGEKNEN